MGYTEIGIFGGKSEEERENTEKKWPGSIKYNVDILGYMENIITKSCKMRSQFSFIPFAFLLLFINPFKSRATNFLFFYSKCKKLLAVNGESCPSSAVDDL